MSDVSCVSAAGMQALDNVTCFSYFQQIVWYHHHDKKYELLFDAVTPAVVGTTLERGLS